jgi:hypothetical protein
MSTSTRPDFTSRQTSNNNTSERVYVPFPTAAHLTQDTSELTVVPHQHITNPRSQKYHETTAEEVASR